jgi:membrane protease YdiL (CAAX protease family)
MESTIGTGDRRRRALRFDRSLLPLVVFLLGGLAIAAGFLLGTERLIAEGILSRSPATRILLALGAFGPMAILAWAILRWEGIEPTAVGVEPRHLLPGIVLVVAIWLGAHLLTILWQVATGSPVAVGIPPAITPADWYTSVIAQLLIVGIIEEFAFRGYFQNKFVALIGGGNNRRRKAIGILTATAIFALWHIPQRVIVQDAPVGSLPPMLIFLFLYGLFFGVMYDLSRNILFTGILHGTFNFQPIVLAGSQGQPDLTVTWFVLPLAALAIWGYRRWAKQTHPEDFRPQVLE